jgi:threonine/homoserine/homoserine lactone efflux protein
MGNGRTQLPVSGAPHVGQGQTRHERDAEAGAAYTMIRAAGGGVLAVLGVSTLLSLRRRTPPTADAAPARWGGYLAGLATNLGNPKAGVFAISLLPQFLTPDGPVF